jgi:hypothetical protein
MIMLDLRGNIFAANHVVSIATKDTKTLLDDGSFYTEYFIIITLQHNARLQISYNNNNAFRNHDYAETVIRIDMYKNLDSEKDNCIIM